jgi:hypothetical protein
MNPMSDTSSSKGTIVGLSLTDGSIVELAKGTVGPSSDRVDQVIIPTSVPWEDGVQLFRAPLEFAGSEERAMGAETIWDARYRGTVPNSGDEFVIEAIFMEYPGDDFQLVEINEDEAVSFAHFESGDLRSYIRANS